MIPATYTFRNIAKHPITTTLTILGISLVVFVYAGAMMLTTGLRTTLVDTGRDDNVVVIRRAAQTEVQSILAHDQAQIVRTAPEIAKAGDGTPLFTNEVYVLIELPKRANGRQANIVARGVTEKSLALRPNITLAAGRMWNEGTSEIIAGRLAAERFVGCGLGETVRFGMRDWTVVGVFDAQRSGFDSELWGDLEQFADAFRRPVYSSLTFRMADTARFAAMKERLEADPRLPVDVKREKEYYAAQSRTIAAFITIAGRIISIVFSLGAIVGAMITMYAAVANRTREIGTLRALGFSRFNILTTFLWESVLLSLAGGVLGLVGASFLRFLQISTTNWDTFSEIVFNFGISSDIAVETLVFALVMGIAGGFSPAVRAARLKIVEALRAA